jgi:hypothetical protein
MVRYVGKSMLMNDKINSGKAGILICTAIKVCGVITLSLISTFRVVPGTGVSISTAVNIHR